MKINHFGAEKVAVQAAEKDGTILFELLSVKSSPTKPESVVNKSYLDYAISQIGGGIPTGGLLVKANSSSVTGYLRCNGALVSKTTYTNLYAAIGNTYSLVDNLAAGLPWRDQYSINTTQSGALGTWTTGATLSNNTGMSNAVVTKNRVYLFGGMNGANATTRVLSAVINSDGSLGTWSKLFNLPVAVSNAACVVIKNHVYLVGGASITNTDLTTTANSSNIVYMIPINSDGTLDQIEYSVPLPYAISRHSLVVTSSRLYVIGGTDDGTNASTRVFYSDISDIGHLSNWVYDANFPIAIQFASTIVIKDKVYVIGGNDGTSDKNTIYYATVSIKGIIGGWSLYGTLPETVSKISAYVTKNTVYLLGGIWTGSTNSNKIYTATINSDGTLGTWSNSSNLAIGTYGSSLFATLNRLYMAGGYKNNSLTSRVDLVTISGGYNDYSNYYGDGVDLSTPTDFYIPDYTPFEKNDLYYFIKT